MAKKRPGPVPPGTKHVRLELTEEQQEVLRALAYENRLSMAAMARLIMVQAFEAYSRKKGGKV